MKHLLVTTDFSPASEPAFQYVKDQAELIGKDQCRLTLLTVVDDVAPTNINFELGLAIENQKGILDALHKKAEENVQAIAKKHFTGFPVQPVVLKPSQPTYQEIVAFAQAHDVDLIVMSTHGRTGIRHFLLGSVTERVIRHASCPVVVVPAIDHTGRT